MNAPGHIAFGITAAEAAENLRRLFGVPDTPPRRLELVGQCPHCGAVALHYLGERAVATESAVGATMGPTIGRECRCCGHAWEEMLDA